MPIEASTLLFLLLPLAAASGWWLAQRKRQAPESPRTPLPRPDLGADYLKGLNYLVNDQADKAIEVFVGLMEVDNDTVETHLALGALFRRRGEVDRALRIHQNIIARPNLARSHRQQAVFELGRDYLRAGVLDRAESLFRELLEEGAYAEAALQRLISIYEQERDWRRAIDAGQRYRKAGDARLAPAMANYHCELAEEMLGAGDTRGGRSHLKQALQHDEHCLRAVLLHGRLHFRADEYRLAIRCFRQIVDLDPGFIPEVIQPLLECYRQLGRDTELRELLTEYTRRYDGVAPYLALAALAYAADEPATAEQALADYVANKPDLEGLGRLFEAVFPDVLPEHNAQLLEQLRGALRAILRDAPAYRCGHCGFSGRTLHWQCPSCKQWNSTRPSRHAPADLPPLALPTLTGS